jgi:hypothetical protein
MDEDISTLPVKKDSKSTVYLREKPDVEVQAVVLWSDLNAVAVDLQPKGEAGHPRHQAPRVQVHNDPNLCLQP